MSNFNVFKFFCVDCGAEQFIRRSHMSRRSRPRCMECGSTFLEPKTEKCRTRTVDGQSAADQQLKRTEEIVGLPPAASRGRDRSARSQGGRP